MVLETIVSYFLLVSFLLCHLHHHLPIVSIIFRLWTCRLDILSAFHQKTSEKSNETIDCIPKVSKKRAHGEWRFPTVLQLVKRGRKLFLGLICSEIYMPLLEPRLWKLLWTFITCLGNQWELYNVINEMVPNFPDSQTHLPWVDLS